MRRPPQIRSSVPRLLIESCLHQQSTQPVFVDRDGQDPVEVIIRGTAVASFPAADRASVLDDNPFSTVMLPMGGFHDPAAGAGPVSRVDVDVFGRKTPQSIALVQDRRTKGNRSASTRD